MSINAGGATKPRQQSGTTNQDFIASRGPTPKAFYFLPF
jgi:hypothetical protein